MKFGWSQFWPSRLCKLVKVACRLVQKVLAVFKEVLDKKYDLVS